MIKSIAAFAAIMLLTSIVAPAYAVKGTEFIVITKAPGEKIEVEKCTLKFYDENDTLMHTYTLTSEGTGKTFKMDREWDNTASVGLKCVDSDKNVGETQHFPVKKNGVNVLKYTGFN